jgi:hypothetical protein
MKKIMAKLLIASIMLGTTNLYAYTVSNHTGSVIHFVESHPSAYGMDEFIDVNSHKACPPDGRGCTGSLSYALYPTYPSGPKYCDLGGIFQISGGAGSAGYSLNVTKESNKDGSFKTLRFTWDKYGQQIRTNLAQLC